MFGSRNKRFTSKGKPIWYVFIDESGVPGYRQGDNLFLMSAIQTDDPELLSRKVLRHPSETTYIKEEGGKRVVILKDEREWTPPGNSEIKFESTHDAIHDAILDDLGKIGARGYTVIVRKQTSDAEGLNDHDLYKETFQDLMSLLNENGPSGLYRIFVDESVHFDRSRFQDIARNTLKGPEKKLDRYLGVLSSDSILIPGIQAADVFVGSQRKHMSDPSEVSKRMNSETIWKTKGARHNGTRRKDKGMKEM